MAEGEPEGSGMNSLEDRIQAVEQKAREDRIEREKAGKPRGLSYEAAVARTRSGSTNGSGITLLLEAGGSRWSIAPRRRAAALADLCFGRKRRFADAAFEAAGLSE